MQPVLELVPQLEARAHRVMPPLNISAEDIQIPVPASVPLEVPSESRTLLESGVSEGGRNTNGAVSPDLIGTALHLQTIKYLMANPGSC